MLTKNDLENNDEDYLGSLGICLEGC